MQHKRANIKKTGPNGTCGQDDHKAPREAFRTLLGCLVGFAAFRTRLAEFELLRDELHLLNRLLEELINGWHSG